MKHRSVLRLLASVAALRTEAFQFQCRRTRATHGPRLCAQGSRDDAPEDAPPRLRRDDGVGRRSLLHAAGWSLAGTASSGPFAALGRLLLADPAGSAHRAHAMGLVQFPCRPGTLTNTYHVLRAGESGLEAAGVLSTNPLFLTNRDDALTDAGTRQVEEACSAMMSAGINPSVVKYSLASKCIDSANIVATSMMVGRNRIVPEFTFMDPRGAGLWDGKPLAATEAALWALDANKAGNEGRDGRPPATDDGTANETLFEQTTRLRQLMSVLETQYSGDTILLIFPDGTTPALLSCLIAGIPLKHVHALNFLPGEIRHGVNMNNARQLLDERLASPAYAATLARGQDELRALRLEEEALARSAAAPAPRRRATASDEQHDMERVRHRARREEAEKTRRPASGNGEAAEAGTAYGGASVGVLGALGCLSLGSGGGKAEGRSAPVLADTNSTVVSAATTEVTAVPPTASSSATTTTIVLPARDLVEAAETAIAGAAFGAPSAAEPSATTDYDCVIITSTEAAPAAAVRSRDAADGIVLPERELVAAAEQAIAAAAFAPMEEVVVPSTDVEHATATEVADAPEGMGLPGQDLFEAAEHAIAGAVFARHDAYGRAIPTSIEDASARPERELVAAAETAMEEYLSQDDGGEDWLTSMRDMMEE